MLFESEIPNNLIVLEEFKKNSMINNNKEILLQPTNMKKFGGPIYDVLIELCTNIKYIRFKKYLVVKDVKKFKKYFIKRLIFNVRLLQYESNMYYNKLSEAKYLITDNNFTSSFIKRKDQILISIIDEKNVAETGKSNSENSYALGNIQRNLIMSDYIVCLNENILNKVRKEYMLDNLYNGKYFVLDVKSNKNRQAISKICKTLLNKFDGDLLESKQFNNNKEKVIIFTGSLIKNGITASLKGLINNIDLNKRNYYLTFYQNEVKKNKYLLSEFPEKLGFIPINGEKIVSEEENKILNDFYEENIIDENTTNVLKNVYKREISRIYPGLKFDYAIDFCGYNKEIINLFIYMDAVRIRYTHSNLRREYETRQNIHLESLKLAYQKYDKVIGVREGMEDEINNCFESIKPKEVKIVHNLNDIENIKRKSKLPIEFDEKTYSNIEKGKLEEILNDKNTVKFINISRFSKEKGLDRLIEAFDEFCKQKNTDKKVYLIIIGGHGKIFDNICDMVNEKKLDNVIIIRNIKNPLSILKKCDLYILSSYYEGLPMTIMESLILDIKTMAVNIEGPRKFFEKGYVYIVDNSTDGIIKGMNDYINGEIKELNKFDSEEFNKVALKEFENIF